MNESRLLWSFTRGTSPVMATAIHHGHHLRPEVAANLVVDSQSRLREEDPYTAELTTITDNRLVVHRSRFEMDLNRNRNSAIYFSPQDAWGIRVWKQSVNPALFRRSLAQYDAFYKMLAETLGAMVRIHGKIVVLDFHSYNHRRGGPGAPFDDSRRNAEIEIGSDTMDRSYWAPVVDPFISDLRNFHNGGTPLDVRENVRFGAGWMSQWIHERFPFSVCVISVELKKTFMNEWTGQLYPQVLHRYRNAFLSTLPGLHRNCRRDW